MRGNILQDETETAGGLGVLIQPHDNLLDLSRPEEELVHLLLGGVEGHVADVNRRGGLQHALVLLLVAPEPLVPVHRQLGWVLRTSKMRCRSIKQLRIKKGKGSYTNHSRTPNPATLNNEAIFGLGLQEQQNKIKVPLAVAIEGEDKRLRNEGWSLGLGFRKDRSKGAINSRSERLR